MNKSKNLIPLSILLFSLSSFWQTDYEIRDMSNKEFQESGQVGSGEIHVINYSSMSLLVDCSTDKRKWGKKQISNKGGIEVQVTSDVQYFYVRYCILGSIAEGCDTYRLTPGKRYVFRKSSSEKIILRKLDD